MGLKKTKARRTWKVEPARRARGGPRCAGLSAHFRGSPDPPLRSAPAGTVPSSPPVPHRRPPSRSNALAAGLRTLGLGASFPFGFARQIPKTRNPAGGAWAEGNSYSALGTPSPPAPSFCLRLAASLAPMQPSLPAASEWPSGGGGGELRGSGREMGQGEWAGSGKAPRRPASARRPAAGQGGGAASARERLPLSPPSSPGWRDRVRARGPGEERAGENRRAAVSF